jgi:hypothetical protein
MKLFNLINMSDALTFYAPSLEIAGAMVGILGGGTYGAADVETDESTPVMFGWHEWLKERGMEDLNRYAIEHSAEILAAMRSVYLGKPKDRPELDAMLAAQEDNVARIAFRMKRNDTQRSSTNDIEGNAHDMADKIEKKLKEWAEKQAAEKAS